MIFSIFLVFMYKINFFVAYCYLKEAQERLKIFRNDIRKILYLLQSSNKVRYIFPGFDKHFKDNRARLLTLLKSEVKRWRISRLHISSRSPNVKQSRLFSIIVLDRLVPRVFPFFWERRPAHSTAKKKRNRRATRGGRVCHVNEHFHRKRRFFVIRIEGVTRDGHSFRMSTKSNSVARIFRGDFQIFIVLYPPVERPVNGIWWFDPPLLTRSWPLLLAPLYSWVDEQPWFLLSLVI